MFETSCHHLTHSSNALRFVSGFETGENMLQDIGEININPKEKLGFPKRYWKSKTVELLYCLLSLNYAQFLSIALFLILSRYTLQYDLTLEPLREFNLHIVIGGNLLDLATPLSHDGAVEPLGDHTVNCNHRLLHNTYNGTGSEFSKRKEQNTS